MNNHPSNSPLAKPPDVDIFALQSPTDANRAISLNLYWLIMWILDPAIRYVLSPYGRKNTGRICTPSFGGPLMTSRQQTELNEPIRSITCTRQVCETALTKGGGSDSGQAPRRCGHKMSICVYAGHRDFPDYQGLGRIFTWSNQSVQSTPFWQKIRRGMRASN